MSVRRVMFFRPSLGDGGADRVTLTLLEKLDRTRYQPSLVLVRREGVLVDRVPSDVPVITLGARRLLVAGPALAHVLRRERPDTLFCTAGGANTIAVLAHRLSRSRARLVLSERNAVRRPGFELRNRFDVPLKRRLYRLADVVTAVSDGVGADLISTLRLPPELVLVTYNPVVGPDLTESARAALDHPWVGDASRPLVVAVGRLVAQKDYPTMLRAFVSLRDRFGARLVILGIGAARGAIEALVGELGLGLGEDISLVGFDPNPFRWMARATLLLQSSIAEGLPGTLIQAMACGAPVVATDCDHGPREVVHDGVDGFLVPVGDSAALAERASRLLGDPALRARMARAASEAARRYSVEESLRRYETAIDGAV